MKQNETALVRELLLFLNGPTSVAWRSQAIKAKAPGGRIVQALPTGHADIAAIARTACPNCGADSGGRSIFVEAKSATGRLRPEQRTFRDSVAGRGAIFIEARSVDDVRAALAAAGIAIGGWDAGRSSAG